MLHPRITAVLQRWSQFQHDLHQRFTQVLTEAETGCADLLDQCDQDPAAMANAWTAMHARAAALGTRLDDTWNDQVEARLEEAEADPTVEASARAELEALQERMEVELEATRLRVFANAARKIWARALAEAAPRLSCSQCGTVLTVPATFRSANVPCLACRALNTYEPGHRIRMIEHFCVHPLCEEATWEQWLEMRKAEQALHASRTETLGLLQAYERAQIGYWDAYLRTRIGMLPETESNYDADLRGRMQQWYRQVEHSSAWAGAGRPRALL